MKYFFWGLGVYFCANLYANSFDEQPEPWLTGPLIAPIGTVVPYGHLDIESYVYCMADTGMYDSHGHGHARQHNFYSLNPQILCFFGLTPWMDINVVPSFFYNYCNGEHSWEFGDLSVALDFQCLDPNTTKYFPGIKLTVEETFPTGNYQKLNPSKFATDVGGQGAFATAFGIVFYKLYPLGKHWLSTTYNAVYTITNSIHVTGYNVYGGGAGTRGTVSPGNSFQAIVSFEFSLNQNWALALDNVYLYTDQISFRGKKGLTSFGEKAPMGSPSSEQLSFAPAIEYNFSQSLGICAGYWFSLWGRNSSRFGSGVINVDYFY